MWFEMKGAYTLLYCVGECCKYIDFNNIVSREHIEGECKGFYESDKAMSQ